MASKNSYHFDDGLCLFSGKMISSSKLASYIIRPTTAKAKLIHCNNIIIHFLLHHPLIADTAHSYCHTDHTSLILVANLIKMINSDIVTVLKYDYMLHCP